MSREAEFQAEVAALAPKAKDRAEAFYRDHKVHVERLIRGAEGDVAAYAPSGSDAYRPELWRAPHWLWYLTGRR